MECIYLAYLLFYFLSSLAHAHFHYQFQRCNVLATLVPLYLAIILAYASVRWWRIFTPDQCFGIDRFVIVFSIPLLSVNLIAFSNLYSMNYRFIAADSLQKITILVAFFLWNTFTKHGSLEWMITIFLLSTMSNTLVVGIPVLKSMYGDLSASPMVQIIALQVVIWNTVILFMFEYRAAKLLIAEQFPRTTKSITSFKVDSDVVSLGGTEPSEADSENKSRSKSMTPRASNLAGVDIYSLQSSGERTPRWQTHMPTIVEGSITILSNGGLGSTMFSLRLFMASQPKIIACGKPLGTLSMAVRFLAGPAVMAATSAAMAFGGVFLQVSIVQAALPLGLVPFVDLPNSTMSMQMYLALGNRFAKQYNVHADVLSTGVSFGMLIALPIALLYYVLLGL